jgi:hypothetical protein
LIYIEIFIVYSKPAGRVTAALFMLIIATLGFIINYGDLIFANTQLIYGNINMGVVRILGAVEVRPAAEIGCEKFTAGLVRPANIPFGVGYFTTDTDTLGHSLSFPAMNSVAAT